MDYAMAITLYYAVPLPVPRATWLWVEGRGLALANYKPTKIYQHFQFKQCIINQGNRTLNSQSELNTAQSIVELLFGQPSSSRSYSSGLPYKTIELNYFRPSGIVIHQEEMICTFDTTYNYIDYS